MSVRTGEQNSIIEVDKQWELIAGNYHFIINALCGAVVVKCNAVYVKNEVQKTRNIMSNNQ